MKKSVLIIGFILAINFAYLAGVSASNCDLRVSLVNQDPYPAIPGDYVKVVLQIDGLSSPACGNVEFGLKEEFPFSLDPNTTNPLMIKSGTGTSSKYGSFYIVPFKLRVSEDALDGDNLLETYYSSDNSIEFLNDFNISVKDTRADFEVYVKDYDPTTNILTFEILNTAKSDVKALTMEIPKQDNIKVKGANRKVVGDLDSNEYTSADFEATPSNGKIDVTLIYTDSINVRRTLNKTINYDSSYFSDRNDGKKSSSIWIYIIIVLVIAWIVWRQVKKANVKKKLREKAMAKH